MKTKLSTYNRGTLITKIAIDLAARGTKEDRIPIAVEEWLDGHKWAGDIFDRNGWDFRRFVLDISKVYRKHTS